MSSRPEVERALLRAGSNPSHEDAERFYTRRVGDFVWTVGGVFGGFYLVGIVGVLVLWPAHFVAVHVHPLKLFNLLLALAGLGLGRLLHGPRATPMLAMAVDVTFSAGMMLLLALCAPTVPPEFSFFFFPLFAGTLILVVRAALVPSLPLRTLLVGGVTSLPMLWGSYVLAGQARPRLSFSVTLVLLTEAVWCAGIVISTFIISRVIYGLRRDVATAKRLGQYVLGELIGEGGMGAVYHAQHAMLRRPTAVKLLLPERAGPENIARFEREVQLTARLTHPNTVAVYDYGRTPDGVFYYAMEYLDGLSLEDLVRRFGPQPAGRVVHVLMQASAALIEAHSLGLIHRDVKPANILLCERGGAPDVAKLLDFGLVKSLVTSQGADLTHTDAITGTPQYLAPESILDPTNVDPRVDLYALGGVGYFLLTGRPVFEGKSVLEVCGHHLHTKPEPPSSRLDAPVSSDLERLLLRCLEKDRALRPKDAEELHELLVECARQSSWSRDDALGFWRTFRDASQRPDRVQRKPGQSSDLATGPTLDQP